MSSASVFLLVEDDVNDAAILKRAFVQARVLNPLMVVRTGEEALEYLSATGRYANRMEYPLPSVVLLDLKLPGMDGFQVLEWIRAHPDLKGLRVVILSGSEGILDVRHAYALGANSFLVKPTDFERFVEISRAFNGHWVWLSKAPEVKRGGVVRRGGVPWEGLTLEDIVSNR